jgi:kynureninase
VLANAAFGAAADIWREVDPVRLDARHASLTATLAALLAPLSVHGLQVMSPSRHAALGGHVAVRFAHAQALANALLAERVVVSARKPDALRFGVHPITTRHEDLWIATERLATCLRDGRWRDPAFARETV